MASVIESVELPNGVKLPYVEQGDASGIYRAAPARLSRLVALLRAHAASSAGVYALFADTQRGHGDASRPAAGYRTHDFVADLVAFMDVLHLKAAVVGDGSSGGFVARRSSIDHPERALGLVLISSPLTLGDKPGVLELWDSAASKLTDPIDPGFAREFQQSTLAQQARRALLETLVQENLKVPALVWRATFEGLLEGDLSGTLGKIKAPTLIL